MVEECRRQHIQSVPYRFAEMVVHPEYIYIPELDKELIRKYRQTSFVTYEHPYKGKVFSFSEMRWLYIEQVDKNEYSEFSIWVTDMLKSGVFQEMPNTHHRCKYCSSITEGSNEDLLCEGCRKLFGHVLYSEL
mgnify:FL=1